MAVAFTRFKALTTGIAVRREIARASSSDWLNFLCHWLPPVQRHRHDGVEALISRQRVREKSGERAGQRPHTGIFVKVDELAECAFIRAVAIGRIKTTKAAAAQCAAAFLIQRVAVLERRSATTAEKFGVERLWLVQALGANRNAGNFGQRPAADAAIIGK